MDESLQMRPDRLILADARGGETLGALTAMGGAVNGGVIGVDAESPDELSFKTGEKIWCTPIPDPEFDGWMIGVNERGKEGLVPDNFLQKL